jgi:hypothetical protein
MGTVGLLLCVVTCDNICARKVADLFRELLPVIMARMPFLGAYEFTNHNESVS